MVRALAERGARGCGGLGLCRPDYRGVEQRGRRDGADGTVIMIPTYGYGVKIPFVVLYF